MDVRNIERTVINQWLRAMRFPIDAGAHLVPNGDNGPRNGLLLAIDRADATIRGTLGRLLNDEELQDDARRRRVAADERARALELRVAAQQRKVEADGKLAERQDGAEQLREQAARTATEREEQAERQRQERKERVRQTADKQQTEIEGARDAKEHVAEEKAKRERLQVLDEQADALDTESDALTASDEAQRLAKAAAAAKARRKGTT
jgi:hypothetical protein